MYGRHGGNESSHRVKRRRVRTMPDGHALPRRQRRRRAVPTGNVGRRLESRHGVCTVDAVRARATHRDNRHRVRRPSLRVVPQRHIQRRQQRTSLRHMVTMRAGLVRELFRDSAHRSRVLRLSDGYIRA